MKTAARAMPNTTRAAALGIALAAGGLCAAWMIHGITATEPDTPARSVRIAAGVFLLIVELAAIWLAARLPAAQRRQRWALLALAGAIAGIDIGQMALAQIALHRAAEHRAAHQDDAARQLHDSIQRNAGTIAALRQSAAAQADSKFPASRADGAASLRLAAEIEQRISADRAQLARLHDSAGTQAAPLERIIGRGGIVALTIALSALVAAAAALAAHIAGQAPATATRQHATPAAPRKTRQKPRSTAAKAQKPAQPPYPAGVVELQRHRKPPAARAAQGELFADAA